MADDETTAKPRAGDERRGWQAFDWDYWRKPHEGVAAALYGAIVLVALLVGATAILLVVRTFLPVWSSEKLGTDDLRNLLIAIGAIVAAPFAIWRIIISHWSAQAAREQAKISRENLYTSLFTKAVEQLGATREVKDTREIPDGSGQMLTKLETITRTVPNTEVRLGAIYALERIAQDSERDHWPIMETLCAYIRNNGRQPTTIPQELLQSLSEKNAWIRLRKFVETSAQRPSPDVQAAIAVIGRSPRKARTYEKQLQTQPNDKERLDLRGVWLQRASFDGLELANVWLDDSRLEGSSFVGANLAGASLRGAHLEGSSLNRSILRRATMLQAHLEGATAYDSDVSEALLIGANLNGAQLANAKLTRAQLDHAYLQNASLDGATLNCASFDGALLNGASIYRASLTGAWLCNADLSQIGIDKEQLAETFGNPYTVINYAGSRPESWLTDDAGNSLSNEYRQRWAATRSVIHDTHLEKDETRYGDKAS
ncbi:pentapeptide repeat-containing protein [Terrarubrum flagellatum]|uniref:pentapeptide repeat-containing protein n=1 Tax=Terrirubrum flagellatum TaxID=2895980 RepID=UPI0031455283